MIPCRILKKEIPANVILKKQVTCIMILFFINPRKKQASN
jgi:hypothetical protein